MIKEIKIKFTLILINGKIVEETYTLEKSIEESIKDLAYEKNWFGGRFLEICVTVQTDKIKYHLYLDILNSKYNLILGS
jgi:hypothetical protein